MAADPSYCLRNFQGISHVRPLSGRHAGSVTYVGEVVAAYSTP